MVAVESVEEETPEIRTLTFRDGACSWAEPGQFVMVWLPGVDENPMSLSQMGEGGLSAVSVRGWSESSLALYRSKPGSLIGVRGPYGKPFTPRGGGRALLLGGGTGLAPLIPLAERLARLGARFTLLMSGKNAAHIPFLSRAKRNLENGGGEVVVVTEDGSLGVRGLGGDVAAELLAKESFDVVYMCGPEKMLKKVFDAAERAGVEVQASLERIMKCGVGLCGSCVIGGLVLCREGPVLRSSQLRGLEGEFGVFWRDASGAVIPF